MNGLVGFEYIARKPASIIGGFHFPVESNSESDFWFTFPAEVLVLV